MRPRNPEHYPLSYQQEEELRDYGRHPEYASSSCEVRLFRLGQDVDTECLSGAVDDLTGRHPALRTTMGECGSGPTQWVHERLPPTSADAPRPRSVEALAHRLVRARPTLAGILDGGPLFRAELHDIAGSALFSMTLQHLVFDGWSLRVLWRDLAEFYAARLSGRPPELSPLPMSYGEFAVRQRESWAALRQSAVSSWASALTGCPGTVAWRSQGTAGAEGGGGAPARVLRFDLPAECVREARGLARAAAASPFTVLLCVSGVALSRVLDQKDLLLATDFANRENRAVRQAVGFFANTRLTRVDMRGAPSLPELVASVRDAWRAAEPLRDAPVGPLLHALGRPEFVKVGMKIADREGPALTLPKTTVEEVTLTTSDPYWRRLKVEWSAGESGYRADVIFQPPAVDPSLPAALADEIVNLLRAPVRTR
ncbi:condensation domain-containing protein [Streptomyces sp. NPDC050560]|uniref:condensation domain-containing protein n=1 Tax=Streptomyces sp. NPDC050560 TaxID=3365630 RepID=UPI0037A0CA56